MTNIWDGGSEEANKLWSLCETQLIIRVSDDMMRVQDCMICNDGTEATEQLPNETGLYVCYACKIAQREVSAEFWSAPSMII